MGADSSIRDASKPGSRLLQRAMRLRGLTQQQVATLVGCSQQSVSGWRDGKFVPTSPEHLVRLRDLFGIPLEAWLTASQRRALRRVVAAAAPTATAA